MKNLLYILIPVCLFSNEGYSQDLVDTGKVWNVVSAYNYGEYGTSVFQFSTDTLIGSTVYKKLETNTDSGGVIIYHFIAAREDTLARKIYFRNHTNEVLMYDFSLNAGDQFNPGNCPGFYMTVDSVDTVILLNGESRKRMFFSSPFDEIWIDGIGSSVGLTNVSLYGCTVDIIASLNCFTENDTLKYSNPWYNDCFYNTVGIPEISHSRDLRIYPNPANEYCTVFFQNTSQRYASIELYNSFGVLTKKIFSPGQNSDRISLTDMPAGIYLMRAYAGQAAVSSGILIKE